MKGRRTRFGGESATLPNKRVQRTRLRSLTDAQIIGRTGCTAVVALLSVQFTLPSPALGEIIVEGETSPQEDPSTHRRKGTATAGSRLLPRLWEQQRVLSARHTPASLDVLDTYSREGDTEADRVSAAFAIAEEDAATPRSREAIAGAPLNLSGTRLKNKPENAVTHARAWYHYPLSRSSFNGAANSDISSRMAHAGIRRASGECTRAVLPTNDRREYVRACIRGLSGNDLRGPFLDGKVSASCSKVASRPCVSAEPWRWRLAAWAPMGPIRPSPISICPRMRRHSTRVLEQAQLIPPGGYRQCTIILRVA